jgi:uncharacterized membrane protein YeiH
MRNELALLLVLDLAGTFAFGLNGALTAVRAARLDIVGVLALGMITALGGGIIRDVVIGAIPPAAFRDWVARWWRCSSPPRRPVTAPAAWSMTGSPH